jgi:hypothetical protein
MSSTFSRRTFLAWLSAFLGEAEHRGGLWPLAAAQSAPRRQSTKRDGRRLQTPIRPLPYPPATYVCGRGEAENYFRHSSKPSEYQQDLESNCNLRQAVLYEGIERLEQFLKTLGMRVQEETGDERRETSTQVPTEEEDGPEEAMRVHYVLGQLLSFVGNLRRASQHFQAEYRLAGRLGREHDRLELRKILGILEFRQAQLENWIRSHNAASAIFPPVSATYFTETRSCSQAIQDFLACLQQEQDALEEQWLLNLAIMALGKYPQAVAKKYLLPPGAFQSGDDIGRFVDIAPSLGLDVFSMAGGVIMDDFDNDGRLDLVISSADPCAALHYFHHNEDGTFADWSRRAGLANQLGGLNIVQADFNNDGWLDIFVMRGAWQTPIRPSLLRANGDGTFTDITREAGLALPASTQAAAWADFDNDGHVDLFVGNENAPSQLFHNNGDGTFSDVASSAGVDRVGFSKGAAWGDYDNDGYPDLYVSNEGSENFLYHNNHDGTFRELAKELGVQTPVWSFPVWFFDYDNDGWLDLYVSSHIESVAEVVRSYFGLPSRAETQALYRNLAGKRFQNVTRQTGLDRVTMPMGANFGDIDNDGYLDFYLGTGAPSYAALVPNLLFRNQHGKRFVDITSSSGTGSLQKGHGIAIGDLFHDGEPAIVAQLGGMVPGDKYYTSVFRNPGTHNHWLSVKLVGVKTNRAALGARIKVTIDTGSGGRRSIFRHISSGGSFGASPLEQHIGLGTASRIEELEIWWPTSSSTQTFRELAVDQRIEVQEFATRFSIRRH